jgi:SM-20-related protein
VPDAAYFAQFGLYPGRQFLSSEVCAAVREEMATARTVPGEVWNPRAGETVDVEAKRRTEMVGVAEGAAAVHGRLLAVMPDLARHFHVELSGVQPVKFVRYDAGDFYGLHVDAGSDPAAPAIIRERKVSVVIFLNAEAEEPGEGDYGGGHLTFYGLLPGHGWQNIGHPLTAEEGLLIAFRPDTPHEVTPVTWGSRYTIATWFF